VVVLVVVLLPDVPAALLGRAEALLAAPIALADGEAPAAAPGELGEGLVVVVVVVELEGPALAPRMSMNTTVSPLLAMFRKVPATTGIVADEPPLPVFVLAAADEVPEVEVPEVEEVPLVPLLLADVNDPLHWFWVSNCW
jgi:hypothetical protein